MLYLFTHKRSGRQETPREYGVYSRVVRTRLFWVEETRESFFLIHEVINAAFCIQGPEGLFVDGLGGDVSEAVGLGDDKVEEDAGDAAFYGDFGGALGAQHKERPVLRLALFRPPEARDASRERLVEVELRLDRVLLEAVDHPDLENGRPPPSARARRHLRRGARLQRIGTHPEPTPRALLRVVRLARPQRDL